MFFFNTKHVKSHLKFGEKLKNKLVFEIFIITNIYHY